MPGSALQTDFFWAPRELGITILGEPYHPLLCHVVLPYSNWEWLTVCVSESIALRSVRLAEERAVMRQIACKVSTRQRTGSDLAAGPSTNSLGNTWHAN